MTIVSILRKALIVAIAISVTAQAANQTDTLIVPFSGPDNLGKNVATIVGLQIWGTLRAEAPGRGKVSFGRATVIWGATSQVVESFTNIEQLVRERGAQLGLGGKASRFGDGIVVQPYLVILPFSAAEAEGIRWQSELISRETTLKFSAKMPQSRYSLPPIVIPNKIVEEYTTPMALKVYEQPNKNRLVGLLGSSFTRLGDKGQFSEVLSNGEKGWVFLPDLGGNGSMAVDFVSGTIRLLRTDWTGAIDCFGRVSRSQEASTNMRIDSSLYTAYSKFQLGQDGTTHVDEALRLNSFEPTAIKFKVMTMVWSLKKDSKSNTSETEENRATYQAMHALISKTHSLFPDDDEFMSAARKLLELNDIK